jgi:glycosyltransferase involved in cell wall biosynthesis
VGNYYARQWKEWLRNHVQDIDVIYLHRPHIAERYLEALADLTPRPRLVYFGHDLHFLRVERQAEVECSEVLREEAEDWKRRELAIFEQVDRVYYPSQVEVDRIREEKDYSHVSAIPLYLFPNPTENDTYDPAERSGLIFVGGFGHKPNVDAILWFVGEILPIVRASIPDVRLHVVGSNMPVMVTDLADDGIIVDGFLTDDELTDLYARIRMSVVPLRYGAGVKGKVLESMYRGVPCITTPIGAEGIVFVEDALIVADSHDFARQLIDAYADEERLRNASIASLESIRRYYTYATARAAIASDFGLTMN